MESLQDRLLYWMKKRDIGQKALAVKAGLNETAVRDILKGLSQSPRIDTVLKLCRALEVLPHDLVPELAEMYPPEAHERMADISALQQSRWKLLNPSPPKAPKKPKK